MKLADAVSPAAPPSFDVPADTAGGRAFAVLHEVLTVLAQNKAAPAPPPDHALVLLVQKARLLTGCASAALLRLDETNPNYAVFAAVDGPEAGDLTGSRVHVSDTIAGNTARTGQPYFAFRPTLDAGANGLQAAERIQSAIVVPVFDRGKPVGALAALDKMPPGMPFDGNDFLCLSTLAAAASVALVVSSLHNERARQKRELAILYEAVRNVSGALSAQEVLRVVVEQAAAHMESSAVVVLLINDERTHLYVAEDEGLHADEREMTLPTDVPFLARLLQSPQPTFLTFPDDDDPVPPPPASPSTLFGESPFPGLGARSGLAAPLRSGDEVRGLVLVLSGQPVHAAYARADANLLAALGSQAAIALENAALYEDATRRAEEAATLYDLSQTVSSTLSIGDVLQRVGDAVLSLLSVEKFALFLYDDQVGRLRIRASRNLAPGADERIQPRIGEGIPGWVMEFETPTAVQDVKADGRNASCPLHDEGVVSLMCMPLQVGATPLGVLCALTNRRRLFTVAEMELLYTIANQAAVALENARMYADVRQKNLELRKYFHRVARALGSSQNPQEVPELIASLTKEVMSADRCALHTVRQSGESWRRQTMANVGFRAEGDETSTVERVMGPETPTGWVAVNARPLVVEDLERDARFAAGYDRPARGEATSYLGVPLKSETGVVGVLEVVTRQKRHFRGDEIRLLLTFASQAVVAFEHARTAQEGEKAERRARCFSRLLTLATGGEPVQPDEVVAALAMGLNAPVVLLHRSGTDSPWKLGPTSVSALAADAATVPFERLSTFLRDAPRTETADFQIAVSPQSTEGAAWAVAVLSPPATGEGGEDTQSLLQAASVLMGRTGEKMPETVTG